MTYKDKGSYESSQPCTMKDTCVTRVYIFLACMCVCVCVCSRVCVYAFVSVCMYVCAIHSELTHVYMCTWNVDVSLIIANYE